MPFLPPNQQRQSTEGTMHNNNNNNHIYTALWVVTSEALNTQMVYLFIPGNTVSSLICQLNDKPVVDGRLTGECTPRIQTRARTDGRTTRKHNAAGAIYYMGGCIKTLISICKMNDNRCKLVLQPMLN